MVMTSDAGWFRTVRTAAADVFGVLAVLSIPGMWLAWSETALVAAAAGGVLAGALHCALGWTRGAGAPPAPPRTITPLSDETVAELAGLEPMIYHNRLTMEPRVRRVLDRVRRALREDMDRP